MITGNSWLYHLSHPGWITLGRVMWGLEPGGHDDLGSG